MAQQWYDPATWKAYEPGQFKTDTFIEGAGLDGPGSGASQTYNYLGNLMGADPGAGRFFTDTSGATVLKQGDLWNDYLDATQSNDYGTTRGYLDKLRTQYGITPDDVNSAYSSYFSANPNSGSVEDVQWWGDQARLRALGSGFDALGKTGDWQSLYNRPLETTQQNQQAVKGMERQDDKEGPLGDLAQVLAGFGTVLGAGALGGAFSGLGAASGGAAASAPGALGSGTFGLDIGLGNMTGSLGSLGVGATGTGAVAAGGGALGSGLAGLGAADLAAAGLGGLAGATGGIANAVGNVATNTGANNMDWTDFFTNDPGLDASAFDVSGLPSGPSPLDVPGGLDAINAGGSSGGQGFWDQAKSLLSQGKNIPTSLIKSLFGTDDATSATLSRLLGTGLGGLLDYKASSGQADALKAIADRSWAAGQPYRDRANAAMTPGFDITSIPGLSSAMDTATETYLRKLSATNGNPAGIGAAPSQTQAFVLGNVALPAWQNYFNANSNAGGLSSLATQSGAAATQSATADGGVYGSISNTINKMFAPEVQSSDKLIRSLFGLPG